MYFKDLVAGLRRRWYFVITGLLVTAVAAIGVVYTGLVQVSYKTTSSILLLPPKSALGAGGNPYLNLAGLGQALEVLTTRVNASDDMQQLVKLHSQATITVGTDPTTTGPIVLISVSAPTPAEATEIRDHVAARVPTTLQDMQNSLGIRAYSQISASTLAQDPKPERDIKNLLRALIVIIGAGAALTFLATGYLDSRLLRRRSAAKTAQRPNDRKARKTPAGQSTEQEHPAGLGTAPVRSSESRSDSASEGEELATRRGALTGAGRGSGRAD